MKTNWTHYFSLSYFVKKPLHVSGVFIAHHQEVFTVYVQQLVRVIRLGDCQFHPYPTSCQSPKRITRTIHSEYLLMMGSKYARNI
jgi:hypothetical protein